MARRPLPPEEPPSKAAAEPLGPKRAGRPPTSRSTVASDDADADPTGEGVRPWRNGVRVFVCGGCGVRWLPVVLVRQPDGTLGCPQCGGRCMPAAGGETR